MFFGRGCYNPHVMFLQGSMRINHEKSDWPGVARWKYLRYFLRSFHFTIEALSKLIGELGSLVYNWSSLPNMSYLK
jgi:hypothetical protein